MAFFAKIRSRNSAALCISQRRPFPPNFSRQTERYGPKLCSQKVVGHKSRYSQFLLCLHFAMLYFAFLLKMQLRLKIDLPTKNQKLSQMTPRWCGNTLVVYFWCFRRFFWWFYPLFILKNAYSGHFVTILVDFSRFILESRLHKKSRISTFVANHFLKSQFRTIAFSLARKIGRKRPTLRDTESARISLQNFGIFDSQYFFFAHIHLYTGPSPKRISAFSCPGLKAFRRW